MEHKMRISKDNIKKVAGIITKSFKKNGKLLVCGNGGSCCDAMHFVGEIVCTYKKERIGYPAVCLNSNMAVITAWSNDYSYESAFARQVEVIGRNGDVLVGISTSGKSENVLKAIGTAKKEGIYTIMLTGKNAPKLADLTVKFNSTDTPRIQECTIFFIHEVCGEIERLMEDD